jgi:hypothetical protein
VPPNLFQFLPPEGESCRMLFDLRNWTALFGPFNFKTPFQAVKIQNTFCQKWCNDQQSSEKSPVEIPSSRKLYCCGYITSDVSCNQENSEDEKTRQESKSLKLRMIPKIRNAFAVAATWKKTIFMFNCFLFLQ